MEDARQVTVVILSIMKTVTGSKDETRQKPQKQVAFGKNGAAIMKGVNGGVVSELCGDRAYILCINFMSHRLKLGYFAAVSQNNLAREVVDILSDQYSFYHKSYVKRASLRSSFEKINPKSLVSIRVGEMLQGCGTPDGTTLTRMAASTCGSGTWTLSKQSVTLVPLVEPRG